MIPDNSAPEASKGSAASDQTSVPVLRRETVMAVHDRGRVGLLMGLLALSGVSLGFGLASIGAAQMHAHCPAMQQRLAQPAPEARFHTLAVRQQTRGWLGVQIRDDREAGQSGARVTQVFNDTAADRAGLEPGDLIVAFQAEDIESANDLIGLVRRTRAGAPVSVEVLRDGRLVMFGTHLDEYIGTQRGRTAWRAHERVEY